MRQTAIIFILFIAGSLAIANGRSKRQSTATGKQKMQRKHNRKDQKEFIQMQQANTPVSGGQPQAVMLGSLGDECGDSSECFSDYRCHDDGAGGQCWAKNCQNSTGCEGEGMVCSFGQCESYHSFWKTSCKTDDDCASDAFTCNEGYCWGTTCVEGAQVSGDATSDDTTTPANPVTAPVTTALGGNEPVTAQEGPDEDGNCPTHQVCNFGKNCMAPMQIWQWCAGYQSLCQEGLECSSCTQMCEFSQCVLDSDCPSTTDKPQQCFNGKCYTKQANGYPCEDSKQCHSDNCDIYEDYGYGQCMGYECDYDQLPCEGANAWCNAGVCEVHEPFAGNYCSTEEDCATTSVNTPLLQCNFEQSQCFYQPTYGRVGDLDFAGNTIEWECQDWQDCGEDMWCDYGNCTAHYKAN